MNLLDGKLLGNKILIRKPKAKEVTAGGIMLPPELIDEKNNTTSSREMFKVIKTGHQVVNIQPNDHVYPDRNAQYNHHELNGDSYMIINEDECAMVFQAVEKDLVTPQTAIKLLRD